MQKFCFKNIWNLWFRRQSKKAMDWVYSTNYSHSTKGRRRVQKVPANWLTRALRSGLRRIVIGYSGLHLVVACRVVSMSCNQQTVESISIYCQSKVTLKFSLRNRSKQTRQNVHSKMSLLSIGNRSSHSNRLKLIFRRSQPCHKLRLLTSGRYWWTEISDNLLKFNEELSTLNAQWAVPGLESRNPADILQPSGQLSGPTTISNRLNRQPSHLSQWPACRLLAEHDKLLWRRRPLSVALQQRGSFGMFG